MIRLCIIRTENKNLGTEDRVLPGDRLWYGVAMFHSIMHGTPSGHQGTNKRIRFASIFLRSHITTLKHHINTWKGAVFRNNDHIAAIFVLFGNLLITETLSYSYWAIARMKTTSFITETQFACLYLVEHAYFIAIHFTDVIHTMQESILINE